MVSLSIFNTIEFYVIAAFLAAYVVAACSVHSRRGAARTFFFRGVLSAGNITSEPVIELTVDDNGRLELYRYGIENLSTDGSFNLAVTIIGFNVTITERITPGTDYGAPASRGSAVMDCFAPERYHFQYISETMGRKAACSFNIKPGNRIMRRLD